MARRRRRQHDSSISLFAFQDIIAAVTGVTLIITLLLTLLLVDRVPRSHAATDPQTSTAATAKAQAVADLQRQRDDLARQVAALESGAQSLSHSTHPSPLDVMRARERVEQYQHQRQQIQQALEAEAQDASLRQQAQQAIANEQQLAAALAAAQESLAQPPTVTLLGGERHDKTPLFVEITESQIIVGAVDAQHRPQLIRRFEGADSLAQLRTWAQQRRAHREYFVLLVRPSAVARFDRAKMMLAQMGFDLGWDVLPPGDALFDNAPERASHE